MESVALLKNNSETGLVTKEVNKVTVKLSKWSILCYVLNMVDLLFTNQALQNGAWELNPFMRVMPVMVFYKVVLIGGLLLWLGTRPEKSAKRGVMIATAVFAAVNVWHIVNVLIAAL